MTSNYGWDANGMEREPFPARDEHAKPRRAVGRDVRKIEAHRRAVAAHPECEDCRRGLGTLHPGPGHCETHNRRSHCTAAPCW